MSRAYLGYRGRDLDTPVSEFFDPEMAPLPGHVVDALHGGPQPGPALLAFDSAATLLDGDHRTENGYGTLRGGGYQVSVATDMPGVTPPMWDWWFGWHGSDTRRYKLWHPRAHASARWADGRADLGYVGRTSLVEEYVGSAYARVAIRFVGPEDVGLPAHRLDGAVAICARLGSPDVPVDIGWLIHLVEPTPTGARMRSRFWLGGAHVAPRRGGPTAHRLSSRVIRPIAHRQLPAARDLLVHCAQEMNHLSAFLPALHERFGPTA